MSFIVSQVCPDEIITETNTTVVLPDCDTTTMLCLDIPFTDIGNFVIRENGQPYTDTIVGCDFEKENRILNRLFKIEYELTGKTDLNQPKTEV